MEKYIDISIIIPVYNVSPYINRCVQSLQKQTYKGNIECIFINDCSTDDSCNQIIKAWGNYDGHIQWSIINHKKNKGLSAARNTGIKHSKGEYLYFLDSDDEISHDCIELLVEPIILHKYDLVIGNYHAVNAQRAYPPLLLETGGIIGNKEIIENYFHGNFYMMAWNKLCKREFIYTKKLYFKEGLIHEDDLWSYCVACEANNIYIVNQFTYFYYIRNDSIATNEDKLKHHKAYIEVVKNMYNWALQSNFNKREKWRFVFFRLHYSILWSAIENDTCYKETYYIIRNLIKEPITNYWKKKWLTTKELCREIHWFFPTKIGLYLLLLDFKLFKK